MAGQLGCGVACVRGGLRAGTAWILACLFLVVPLRAQSLAMHRFDNREGIPQSQVGSLLEDRQGFIWASTADGLARVGPNGSQIFDARNGLKAKDITALVEDREGAIWVSTAENGVARIRGRQVSIFGVNEGLLNENIHSLVETRQGVVLAGSHQGLFQKRGERFEKVPLPEPWSSSPITALAVDGGDSIWIGSRHGALARWDGAELKKIELPPQAESGTVLGLKVDPSGLLWALQSERLLMQTREGSWSVDPLPGLPPLVVLTSFSIQADGELILVLGSDGLYLRRPGGSYGILNARGLPCRAAINCALRDRHGALWIGTDGDYLWTQPFPGLQSLSRHPTTGTDLGLGTVTCFLELPGNRMLLGSNTGVFLWEEGKGLIQQWHRQDGLATEDVWALLPDEERGAWVGTMKGLHRLGPGGRLLPGPKELAKAYVQCLVRRSDRLWVGTDQGLAELDLKGHFLKLHDQIKDTGYSAVHCLFPRESDLLVGTSLGLFSFKDGAFSRPYPGNPADKLQVLAIHEDPQHRLWIGTSQSLFTREPKDGAWAVSNLSAGGQPLSGITWIRTLSKGATAIGHTKGVTFVSPEGAVFHLTRRMGLLSDETNQDAALEDSHGRLWIGMVGGACLLDRLEAFPASVPPTPVVLDLTWERGSFWLPKDVTLPPGFTNLAVHVDAGSPNSPFPVHFEARREGADSPWLPLDPGLGGIYYGGLGYGTHRLVFRASFDGADWRETNPIEIRIQPPWYLTLWAKGALALLVFMGCLALVIQRVRLLEQNNRDLEAKVLVRTRELEGRTQELALRNESMQWIHRELRSTLESRMQMINTVSHDLRSPLTTIQLSVDRVQEFTDGMNPKVMKIFGVLAHEAKRLDSIIKSVLDRNRGDSLADQLSLKLSSPRTILENVEDSLTLKAESRGLRSYLSLDPASLDVNILLDPAAMQQVLFNLVENALKFTRSPGKVGVRCSIREQEWVLEVWDTGRGIPKHLCAQLFNPFEQAQDKDAKKGWGLGLYICRSIVEAHGGRIEVESVVAEGSVFRVTLPIVQPQIESNEALDMDAILHLAPGGSTGPDRPHPEP